jgi:5-methylcytosine-specific restriction endonuclease McrA
MCRFCVMPAPTVDHRLPLAWGGAPYDLANLQAMCEACHGIKTDEERVLGNKLSRGTAGDQEIAFHVVRWTR